MTHGQPWQYFLEGLGPSFLCFLYLNLVPLPPALHLLVPGAYSGNLNPLWQHYYGSGTHYLFLFIASMWSGNNTPTPVNLHTHPFAPNNKHTPSPQSPPTLPMWKALKSTSMSQQCHQKCQVILTMSLGHGTTFQHLHWQNYCIQPPYTVQPTPSTGRHRKCQDSASVHSYHNTISHLLRPPDAMGWYGTDRGGQGTPSTSALP